MKEYTVVCHLGEFLSSESTYASVNSRYPASNPVGKASKNTTYAQIYIKTGSEVASTLYYRFDTSAIPADAIITGATATAKVSASTASESYIATRSMRLSAGTEGKGASGVTYSATATVLTLDAGDWTRDELNDCRLKIYAKRGTSNTSTSRYVNIYGATMTVTYTMPPPSAPTNLRQTGKGKYSLDIAWDASDADGYKLYRDGNLLANQTVTSYADANLAPNKSYTYSVLAYNEDGESEAVNLTAKTAPLDSLSELALITDRTASDVAQKTEKGRYTADDLNRVGMAMDYVRDRLAAAGYSVTVSPKTDWTMDNAPTSGQLVHYLADMRTLKEKMSIETALPENMRKLTYQQANDIEQILLDIDGLLNNIAAAYIYSGEIFSGEMI